MKKVFLIGDSIRFGNVASGSPGYGGYVRQLLADCAQVFAPDENCRFAQYTLRYLHEWAQAVDGAAVDAVYWNNGLWDVLRLFGDEPLTPVEEYANLLRRIYKRIRMLFPNARVIFATSTAVIENMAKPEFFRFNSEIEQYNRAACGVMAELGIPVSDLYALTHTWGEEMHADWVHYNDAACRILAEHVAASLKENGI